MAGCAVEEAGCGTAAIAAAAAEDFAVVLLDLTLPDVDGFAVAEVVLGRSPPPVVVFLTGGTFFYGFGALFNPMVDEFGWSRAATSFAFSLRTEVGGIAAPIVGFLVDRVGSRRLMVFGVVTVALGFVLLSRVQDLWAFYGAVTVIAIGMSAAAGPVGIVAIAHWFRRRRGRALAFMAMGSGASGVMVLLLSWLISAFDWRNALLIIAAAQLAVCLPLALSIRNRPAELGLRPDGDLPEPVEGAAATPLLEPEGQSVAQALRSSAFWRLAVAVALGNLGAVAIIVHGEADLGLGGTPHGPVGAARAPPGVRRVPEPEAPRQAGVVA
jgi:MFS family permease